VRGGTTRPPGRDLWAGEATGIRPPLFLPQAHHCSDCTRGFSCAEAKNWSSDSASTSRECDSVTFSGQLLLPSTSPSNFQVAVLWPRDFVVRTLSFVSERSGAVPSPTSPGSLCLDSRFRADPTSISTFKFSLIFSSDVLESAVQPPARHPLSALRTSAPSRLPVWATQVTQPEPPIQLRFP
jgi:hypothetical protein